MPQVQSSVGLPCFEVREVRGHNPVEIHVRYTGSLACPHCRGDALRTKDRYLRRVRHENQGLRRSYLVIEARKYLCRQCDRYFNQRFEGIGKWRRSTEPYRKQIVWQHTQGISQKTLSDKERLGSATVERWTQELMAVKLHERRDAPCPRVLGLDEHFFTRRKGYATTLCDLQHRNVYDITLGRSEKALEGYFVRLQSKQHVRVVCMDLASNYRALVRKHFPKAKIVADRFHVIRLVNQRFLEVWKLLDPVGRGNRGLLSLMRRHQENLRDDQRARLRTYLRGQPALEAVYDFKQKLCRLLLKKSQKVRQCRRLIPRFLHYIRQLSESGFEPLVSLARTLGSWKEEIACMWRFTRNNGITEGFHTKMEMISRRAFGFRNFENYRLRVRSLCG